MNPARRNDLYLTGALVLSLLSSATLAAASTAASPSADAPAPAPTSPPTAADTSRFGSFADASPAVTTAVANAQTLATAIRIGHPSATVTPAALADAVAQASTAIVQEGRAARSSALADRQAALTRLRLAQSETERQTILEQIRVQSDQDMAAQRESARLVRDRLRELRILTAITTPGGG